MCKKFTCRIFRKYILLLWETGTVRVLIPAHFRAAYTLQFPFLYFGCKARRLRSRIDASSFPVSGQNNLTLTIPLACPLTQSQHLYGLTVENSLEIRQEGNYKGKRRPKVDLFYVFLSPLSSFRRIWAVVRAASRATLTVGVPGSFDSFFSLSSPIFLS